MRRRDARGPAVCRFGAGDEERMAAPTICWRCGKLIGRFAERRDDLREALPDGPMVIDLGEAKVLKWLIPKG